MRFPLYLTDTRFKEQFLSFSPEPNGIYMFPVVYYCVQHSKSVLSNRDKSSSHGSSSQFIVCHIYRETQFVVHLSVFTYGAEVQYIIIDRTGIAHACISYG